METTRFLIIETDAPDTGHGTAEQPKQPEGGITCHAK